jgi:dihydrodipicolinate synthase/N-acetylneuraminate lyase
MTLLEWTRGERGRVAALAKVCSHETVRRILHHGAVPTRKTARLLAAATSHEVSVAEIMGLTVNDGLDDTGTDD